MRLELLFFRAVERFALIDLAPALRPPHSGGRTQAIFALKRRCLRDANVNEASIACLACRSRAFMVGPESRGILACLCVLPLLGACGARVFGDACHAGGGKKRLYARRRAFGAVRGADEVGRMMELGRDGE